MKQLITLATAIFMAFSNLHAQTPPTIVAQGFVNGLIGIEVDSVGKIWATEYGTGNDDGQVTIVDPATGGKTIFMTGLPSSLNPLTGEIAGSFRTYHLPDNKLAIMVGEGPHANAEALIFVDLADFTPGTPLTIADVEQTIKFGDYVHGQGFPQSDPYNVAWASNGDMFVTDAGANIVLKWDHTTWDLSIAASLPAIPNPLPFGPPMSDAVPTDIIPKKDGSGYYVCQLTGFPFVEGAATIFNLDNSGNLTPWQTGFTCLTDMGYDPVDSNLCVMQFGVFGPVDTTLNFIPGTAKVIKIMPNGDKLAIAEGMVGLCPSFTFDATGDLYVTDLFGFVYKYDFLSGINEPKALATQVQTTPNPFSERVKVSFELDKTANVKLNIYALNGALVESFPSRQLEAGAQSFIWEAANAVPGIYLYHLLVDGRVVSGLLNLTR